MWKKITVLAVLIVFLLSAFPFHPAAGQPTTLLSVEPATSFGLAPGQSFLINVTVTDVTNLQAWQFTLYFDSTVLNYATDTTGGPIIEEGPFLQPPGTGFFYIANYTENYNATYGLITVADLRISGGGVNGSGTLVTFNFTVVGSGPSILHLDAAKLIDPGNKLMPFTTVDGEAYVGGVDVAIAEIDTPSSIGQGSMALVNVTAQNKGQQPETFDVTLMYSGSSGSNPIDGTQTATDLPAGQIQVFTYAWDTTGLQMGEYTLTATATRVLGEIDYADNTLSVNVNVGIVNLTITNVNAKTSIPQGMNGTDIQVTVQNNGEATETFTVTLTCNSQFVDTKTTSLDPGAIATVTLNWNTTILPYGNYTIQAYIPPLGFQQSAINFTWSASVTIPGDLNSDFTVGLKDLVILAAAYGSRPGDAKWNPNADIDGNAIIGLTDLVTLATHYGQHYP